MYRGSRHYYLISVVGLRGKPEVLCLLRTLRTHRQRSGRSTLGLQTDDLDNYEHLILSHLIYLLKLQYVHRLAQYGH